MPTINLSELELEYLVDALTSIKAELASLHPDNYYLREINDCIELLSRDIHGE
jgi:hypothetical protein